MLHTQLAHVKAMQPGLSMYFKMALMRAWKIYILYTVIVIHWARFQPPISKYAIWRSRLQEGRSFLKRILADTLPQRLSTLDLRLKFCQLCNNVLFFSCPVSWSANTPQWWARPIYSRYNILIFSVIWYCGIWMGVLYIYIYGSVRQFQHQVHIRSISFDDHVVLSVLRHQGLSGCWFASIA